MSYLQELFSEINKNYILVATSNGKEKTAVKKIFDYRKSISISNHLDVYIGTINKYPAIHIHGGSGGSTDNSIGRLLNEFLLNSTYPKPNIIFLTGFCWGNPKRVSLKDIILCTEIESSNQTRFYENEHEFKSENKKSKINNHDFFQTLAEKNKSLKLEKLISYEAYLGNTAERDLIIKSRPDIGGGEMEGWSFITNRLDIPWIILKSVSDYAENNNDRDIQQECADLSAKFIPKVVDHLISEEITPLIHQIYQRVNLYSFLSNDVFIIKKTDLPTEKEKINQYLNDNIFNLLFKKIKEYNFLIDDEDIIKSFCIFLLEKIQNSIIHGNAKEILIYFQNNIIKYKDNVPYYNYSSTDSHIGGGKHAWNHILDEYIKNNIINFEYKENKYCYKFNHTYCFKDVPKNCNIEEFKEAKNDNCDIYICNFKRYVMLSFDPIIMMNCRNSLEKGKSLYIILDNHMQIRIFNSLKEDFPEKVSFFY